MTLDQWLAQAEARLRSAGVDSPRLDAQVLASHGLKRSRAWVLAHGNYDAPTSLDALLIRREGREPLAYITGTREFFGRAFAVGPGCLVPRQETEAVVELALEVVQPGDRVLDVGTGSGCIAVTLAFESPSVEIWASDRETDALAWAETNVRTHHAPVQLLRADVLRGIARGAFDVVVSNPPYIDATADLQPEVADHEPPTALFASDEGLALYRQLADQAREIECRTLVVEAGDGMADDITKVFSQAGLKLLSAKKDGLGQWRALAFGPGS